jgi:L-asparaginase II
VSPPAAPSPETPSAQPRSPVVAEVVRNGFVESRHHGRVVALAADGSTVLALGDVDAAVFPRSSLKPLQAAAMLRAGWRPADAAEVALACASHSGEPAHLAVVRRILAAAGLDETALQNTPDLPLSADAAAAHLRAGGGKDALHQNCSGKHAAMLATCVVNGWPTETYREPGHPLQVAIRATVEELTSERVVATAVDGCGAPLFATSLAGLARGFAVLAPGAVADAMRAHPELVGGTGRDVTDVMRAVPGLVAKDGAEGVYTAALPDGRAAAVKVDDGAARARGPALAHALAALGVDAGSLGPLRDVPVLGHGEPVGRVRFVLDDG